MAPDLRFCPGYAYTNQSQGVTLYKYIYLETRVSNIAGTLVRDMQTSVVTSLRRLVVAGCKKNSHMQMCICVNMAVCTCVLLKHNRMND